MSKHVLAPIFVLLVGISIAAALLLTARPIPKKPLRFEPPLVRVLVASPETIRMRVSTHGTVMPRTESELVPEVAGRVEWVSPALVSGGFFTRGEPLLRIESLDYDLALEQGRARRARAESDLANARVAHTRQLDLAKQQAASEAARDDAINRLRVAEAAMREAEAALAKAERDLTRTEIVAPYDGRVRSEHVDVGQFVNRGAGIATIYAVDFAEVRLPVQDAELAFLDLPLVHRAEADDSLGAPVTLKARFAGRDHQWQGKVVRTEGELDPKTRMVNVVVQVADPYAVRGQKPPLSVGLFVEAEIIGAVANDVVVLPRSALHGHSQVLVVDGEDRLHFRDVDILRINRDQVLVQGGLAMGDRICLSPLETPVEGMLVRVHETPAALATRQELEASS